MKLINISQTKKTNFNDFIKDHPSGSFLQSWDWGDWAAETSHSVERFMVEDISQRLILAAQVSSIKVPRLNKHYLYIPYGPLTSPGLEESIAQQSVAFFLKELGRLYPQSLFIRLEPKQELRLDLLPGKNTGHIQPGRTLVLDLAAQTTEQLLAQMHSKTRYNIKVAQKHSVEIVSEPVVTPGHGLHLTEAVDLIVQTAGRQRYKSHGPSYYRRLIDFFGQRPDSETKLTVYKALHEKQLLAAAIMVDFGPTRTYLFGGTSDAKRNVMAPYLLHWQAISDAKNSGLAHYDFWGIETAKGDTPGFVRFKLGFGGRQISYPQPRDLSIKPLWYNVYIVLRSLNRKF